MSKERNRFQQALNLEDRSILFLTILFGWLATQASLFFHFLYNKFFGDGERISNVINKEWDWGDYVSRKLNAFGWLIKEVKGMFFSN